MDSTLQNACAQKSDLLMKQYDWHHGPQQQIRESSSNPYLIYYWSHFSSSHCVSWLFVSSEQQWHFFWPYLTVYLMPYLLLSYFLGGDLWLNAKSAYCMFSLCPSVSEQKFAIKMQCETVKTSLWLSPSECSAWTSLKWFLHELLSPIAERQGQTITF